MQLEAPALAYFPVDPTYDQVYLIKKHSIKRETSKILMWGLAYRFDRVIAMLDNHEKIRKCYEKNG